jgi:CubicO group peptidase (beta-lactamase class C family)
MIIPRQTLAMALAVFSLALVTSMRNGGEAAAASNPPAPAPLSREAARIAAVVDPLIEKELKASGIPGAAFVFVQNGRIVYSKGYGFSDLATRATVDPERTIWPIASITKAVTAIGVLQLVDEEKLELDKDINQYLKRLQVPAQGYGPLTLRHLLSHTAALDELPGRQFDGRRPPDMAAFLRKKLVRYRAPGKLTAYSTYGMALAGVLLEDVSRDKYAKYVERHVFRPAGMESARVMRARGDEKGVATPYEIEDGQATAIPHEFYVTPPTSSVVATTNDMGRLMTTYLASVRGEENELLSPALAQAMYKQQATNHPEVPGWGLGLQLDRVNGIDLAEHGGDIGGFAALMTLIPSSSSGFYIVHHGEGGSLRFQVKEALMDALFPVTTTTVPLADPENATLDEYAGRYISSIACRSCPGASENAFTVAVEPNGTLSLWGQAWVPLHKDLFVRDDGRRLLGFARDERGRIVSVTGGSWRVADRL